MKFFVIREDIRIFACQGAPQVPIPVANLPPLKTTGRIFATCTAGVNNASF
jgi:hypothetical protein